MKKHGINGQEIKFTPACVDTIEKQDFINTEDKSIQLFCKEKDVFVIVTPDPCNTFLTDEDLVKSFRVNNGIEAPNSFSVSITENMTKAEKRKAFQESLKRAYNQ